MSEYLNLKWNKNSSYITTTHLSEIENGFKVYNLVDSERYYNYVDIIIDKSDIYSNRVLTIINSTTPDFKTETTLFTFYNKQITENNFTCRLDLNEESYRGKFFKISLELTPKDTSKSKFSSYEYFKINSLPYLDNNKDTITCSNVDENNKFISNLVLTIPKLLDYETDSNKLNTIKKRLYYRTSTSSSNIKNEKWIYLNREASEEANDETSYTITDASSLFSLSSKYTKYYIQFSLLGQDDLEYGIDDNDYLAVSNVFYMEITKPEAPIIANLTEDEESSHKIERTERFIPEFSLSQSSTLLEVKYCLNDGEWLDANLDDFGYYVGNVIDVAGNYTLKYKTVNSEYNLESDTKSISLTIIEKKIVYPIIVGVEEGKVYQTAKITCTNVNEFSDIIFILDGITISNNYTVTEEGSHILKVIGTNIETKEASTTTINFTISNEIPSVIEVYGVDSNDSNVNYNIYIIINNKSNYSLELTKNGTLIQSKNNLTADSKYNSTTNNAYRLYISDSGTYNLKVTATHKVSGLKRTLTISNFKILSGTTVSNIISFNPDTTNPTNKAELILKSGDPINNTVYYNYNGGTTYKYCSPLLFFDNLTVNATDMFNYNTNIKSSETKQYNKFSNYVPELPTINGVVDNETYTVDKTISFVNNASKPTRAKYKIFFDGKEVLNPFSTSLNVTENGVHYIYILAWDDYRPVTYNKKVLHFTISKISKIMLRRPAIIRNYNKNRLDSKILVKFFNNGNYYKNIVTFLFDDGTKKVYEYDNQNKNNILTYENILQNCTVVAKTISVLDTSLSIENSKRFEMLQPEPPSLENFKLFGIPEYNLNINGTIKKVKIGRYCKIQITEKLNETYEIYLNGCPYTVGTLIYNKEQEIKKYIVEVIISSKNYKDKAYYSDEFYLDSINPAFPMLLNYESNLMNKLDIPRDIEIKDDNNIDEETCILNNQIINVENFIINKDNEYILTVTYTYYDGTKRTNSFYFSVNSNPIDELKPLRAELKTLDYYNKEYAKEGELIVDRKTGHLWYKDGVIKPITKNIEDEIINLEKQLINIEDIHNIIQANYILYKDFIKYIKEKQIELYNKLVEYNTIFEKVKKDIDGLSLSEIYSSITRIENEIETNVTIISNEKSRIIVELINSCKTLNENFINLNNNLRSLFDRATYCKNETYLLEKEISKKVLTTSYNNWVNSEKTKFNNFLSDLVSRGVITNAQLNTYKWI